MEYKELNEFDRTFYSIISFGKWTLDLIRKQFIRSNFLKKGFLELLHLFFKDSDV